MQVCLDFAKLVFVVFFIVHWSSCLFYAIGYQELDSSPDNWLVQAQLQDSPPDECYVTAAYFSLLTIATIGYGDIVPITTREKLCVMLILVCACGVFAYIVGYVGSVLDKKDTILSEFK